MASMMNRTFNIRQLVLRPIYLVYIKFDEELLGRVNVSKQTQAIESLSSKFRVVVKPAVELVNLILDFDSF